MAEAIADVAATHSEAVGLSVCDGPAGMALGLFVSAIPEFAHPPVSPTRFIIAPAVETLYFARAPDNCVHV